MRANKQRICSRNMFVFTGHAATWNVTCLFCHFCMFNNYSCDTINNSWIMWTFL